jgi:thiol-disulfide isomerase/thioredoxin
MSFTLLFRAKKRLTKTLACAFLILSLAACQEETKPAVSIPEAHQTKWNAELYPTGDTLSMESDSLTLLTLWATWCASCQQEQRTLFELKQEFQTTPVRLIGVSMDESPRPILARYLSQFQVPYTVALPTPSLRAVLGIGGQLSLPTTFLVDRRGNVIQNWVGPQTLHTFRTALKDQL